MSGKIRQNRYRCRDCFLCVAGHHAMHIISTGGHGRAGIITSETSPPAEITLVTGPKPFLNVWIGQRFVSIEGRALRELGDAIRFLF